MKRVLLLNQDWFAEELRELGFEVVTAGHTFATHLEIKVEMPFLHVDKLLALIPNNWRPDVIIVYDNSAPLAFSGFEDLQIPTIFYSVDTHHHAALHRYLFDVFDYHLIAQRDYHDFLAEAGHSPEWFPLWASRYVDASDQKKYGAVFIGTMNAKLNPERVAFFDNLQKQIDVLCTQGAYWEFFPHAQMVINQTVKSDLNFRVFESMMCGTLLLTEESNNGLFDLFQNGVHLVTYKKNNVEDAAQKIKYYLDNPTEASKIANCGREEILAKHTPMARAKRMAEIINSVRLTEKPRRYASMAVNYLCLARTSKEVADNVRVSGLTHCLRCFEQALQHGQFFDDTLAAQLVVAAHDFDKLSASISGYRLLKRFFERFPDNHVLLLAVVRGAMNTGEMAFAQELCDRYSLESTSATYEKAEVVVRKLLDTL
jgi:hypothetical protein